MTRPSGDCEGQPCYTAGDIEAINDEIVIATSEAINAYSEMIDAQTIAQLKEQEYMDASMRLTELQMELSTAQTNQCPGSY